MLNSHLMYMKDSPLFAPKYMEDNYHRLSDKDLLKALDAYQEYCLKGNLAETQAKNRQNLSIFNEGFDSFLPDESLLSRCALYLEDVIINDPVFELAIPKQAIAKAFNSLLGMDRIGVDREDLLHAASYMNRLRSAIQSGFVKFLPISYIHQPPKEIPITYSENAYSDVLPHEILEWFQKAAEVYPLKRGDKGIYSIEGEPLSPCRIIGIHFRGHTSHRDAFYVLFDFEVVSLDEETKRAEFTSKLPDEPPSKEQFTVWVFQSVNQAAKRFFDTVYKEVYWADQLGCSYLTQSPFVADLLRREWPLAHELKTDVFNGVLDLDLPVLEGVPLDRILDLRQKDGEAFQNFRVELERHLRELRQVTSSDELAVKIQNVAHEISEVQISRIDKKVSEIKRGMFADTLIFVGGLVAIIQANGFGIPALIYAVNNGYNTYNEYISKVRENPAFFLWQLRGKKEQ